MKKKQIKKMRKRLKALERKVFPPAEAPQATDAA